MNVFRNTPDCLTLDELVTALEGTDPDEKLQAEAHLATCAHCRTELNLFRSFEAGEVRPDERRAVDAIAAELRKHSPAARQPWWKGFWSPRMLMPAGLAAAAALLAVMLIQQRPAQLPITGQDQVLRSRQVEAVAPVGDQRNPARSLEWRAVDGAAGYRVTLLEADHTELWSAAVKQTHSELPPAVVAKITAGKTLLWRVEALDASGAMRAESGLIRFRIEGP